MDIRATIAAFGLSSVGEAGPGAASWLVVYDSSRMDGIEVYLVPEASLDPALRSDLERADGADLRDARGAMAVSAWRLALALGGAGADDVEVELLALDETDRPELDGLIEHFEVLWPFRLPRDPEGRVDLAGVRATPSRTIALSDR